MHSRFQWQSLWRANCEIILYLVQFKLWWLASLKIEEIAAMDRTYGLVHPALPCLLPQYSQTTQAGSKRQFVFAKFSQYVEFLSDTDEIHGRCSNCFS